MTEQVLSAEGVKERLSSEEAIAQRDLASALSVVSPRVSERYANLFPESTDRVGESGSKLSLAMLEKKAWKEVKGNILTQFILSGLVTTTVARITEAHGLPSPQIPASEDIVIFLDNLVKWSGSSVKPPLDLLSLINAFGSAMVYVGIPAKAVELISAAQGRIVAEKVRKQNEAMKIRGEKEQAIREGRANLDGKVGPNIQIDVGKSDPAMADLLRLFHTAGVTVVSYWDKENHFFDQNPAWQRTDDDWTDRETLRKGDVRETLCSVILVSNGDDVFLSSHRQDPTKQMQDMTDNEAVGAIHARDSLRKQMSLSPMQHILVTNPQRTIDIGVVRESEEQYKPKTVGELVKKLNNVHLVDPDQLVIEQIARIASDQDLPVELVTNNERQSDYDENLRKVMETYNKGGTKSRLRMATPEDGKRTLSSVYGSTDEDTIAQVTTYYEEFQEGDFVAIINDPAKLGRLPEGIKAICIGSTVAEAIHKKFFELVVKGLIPIPSGKGAL